MFTKPFLAVVNNNLMHLHFSAVDLLYRNNEVLRFICPIYATSVAVGLFGIYITSVDDHLFKGEQVCEILNAWEIMQLDEQTILRTHSQLLER
jgi:hypothetical protein